MSTRRRCWRTLAGYLGIVLLGTTTGVALGSSCDGADCRSDLDMSCVPTGMWEAAICCKDLDGDDVSHCVSCMRDYYTCDLVLKLGPAYNCNSPGEECMVC